MKILLVILGLALYSAAPAFADADIDKGDVKIGKALHDKSCIACHASKYGGDGSKMYTRDDHKVTTKQQLVSRVKSCNKNVGTGWFPEEEAHVEAYLNATYYHLK
ncbi:MAG: cytochrome c [Sulfurimicrobium sp.]